jgi:transposase
MGKPYSQDLRERVIATVDSGTRVCAAARRLFVSVSYVSKVVGRRDTTGETTARTGRAGRKPKLAPHDEAIRARVAACPDATLEELQAWLADECKAKVSIGCLWNRLKFLKLPLKKSRSELPSRSGPMSPRRALTGLQTSHRRDRRSHRHGAPLRPLSARRASDLSATVGTLEDDDLRGRVAAG